MVLTRALGLLGALVAVALAAGCGGSASRLAAGDDLRSARGAIRCSTTQSEGRTLDIVARGLSGCPEATLILGGLMNYGDPPPQGLQCDAALPGCWSAGAERPQDAARFVVAVAAG